MKCPSCALLAKTNKDRKIQLRLDREHRTIIVASRVKHSTTTSIISSLDPTAPPVQFKINSTLSEGAPSWANYVKGTIYQYLNDIPENFAFNAAIVSNVPTGSGLSSSAALE